MIRRANGGDLGSLKEFLGRAGLGTEGLTEAAAEYFLLLENEDRSWRGTLGIEPYQENGLLRSLVVAPGQAEEDIFLLFQQAFQLAKEERIRHLFLATKKRAAVPLFQMLGFQLVDKAEIPAEFSDSAHINHILSVDNSMFLKYSL
jgi:N-acetylglutamate synthase-like GNAT family acetyltransferase